VGLGLGESWNGDKGGGEPRSAFAKEKGGMGERISGIVLRGGE